MGANSLAVVDNEVPVELLAHFLLPLYGKRGWRNDQDPLGTTAGDEFFDNNTGLDSLPESDFVTDEVTVVVRIENLVSCLDLVRFYLDPIVRQRQEPVVPICEVEAGCTFSEVMVDRRIDLSSYEAVDDRVDPLDVGQATRQFPEFTLRGVNVEELAPIRALFDLCDFALPASELDVVPDLKVGHSPIRPDSASSISSLSSSDTP